jgi:hypothetical protein
MRSSQTPGAGKDESWGTSEDNLDRGWILGNLTRSVGMAITPKDWTVTISQQRDAEKPASQGKGWPRNAVSTTLDPNTAQVV